MKYKIMTNEKLIDSAVKQLDEIAKQYKEENRIVVMPDYHAGKGSVVGTTMVITDGVCPNIVSVDIGCGIMGYPIGKELDYKALDEFIRNNIPSGHNIREEQLSFGKIEEFNAEIEVDRALRSIGTLGGGNHFIEVGEDFYTKNKYIFIHSGSRKLGVNVCNYHMEIAKNRIKESFQKRKEEILQGDKSQIQNELIKLSNEYRDVNYDTAKLFGEDKDRYIEDMLLANEYARLNRETILKDILNFLSVEYDENKVIDTIHNYIDKDNVLRKGAVSAKEGEVFVLPLNMKEGVAICVGKGNLEWNESSPHGLGRYKSRSKAREEISLKDFEQSMAGVYSSSVCNSTIDESPMAYKDVDAVLSKAEETLTVLKTYKSIYNFKAK
jgi:RNA-splicing ligase RtcB